MIYSNNNGIATDRILTEVARFQPSASVPASLKKTVIGVCNNILNKSKKLDREDKKVDRALKVIEGAIALAKNNSYTDNAYPVEIHSVITNGEACIDYAVSVVRSMGFKHSNMKEGKKGQTWYKVSGNDILVATIVGTLFGNSIATIILHAVENSDHNNDILNGVLESAALTEGQQADEYKARKAKEAEDKKKVNDERIKKRYGLQGDGQYQPAGDKKACNASGEQYKGNGNRFDYGYTKSFDDIERGAKARSMVRKEEEKRGTDPVHSNSGGDTRMRKSEVMDAANRHIRRHSERHKKSTIFESVEFI